VASFDHASAVSGSAKANGREPKTGLDRVFNFKVGCFDDVRVLIYADVHPHLQLKTRPRFSPVSLSLSMAECLACFGAKDSILVCQLHVLMFLFKLRLFCRVILKLERQNL
jgi:hypothetical protein